MTTWIEQLLARYSALRAPENEGGAGGDTGATGTGGDAGGAADTGTEGGEAKAADPEAGVLGGGTAGSDANPDGGKPAGEGTEGDKSEGDDKAKEGENEAEEDAVPEGDYEFTLPEGVELDAGLAAEVTPVLKELGIGAKAADKLVAAYAAGVQKQAEAIADAYIGRLQQQMETARADAEIGGANWDVSTRAANQTIQKFGTPALVAQIREHGMQNNPELIRLLARVGKATASDRADVGDAVDTSEVPPEQRWYPNTPTNKKG